MVAQTIGSSSPSATDKIDVAVLEPLQPLVLYEIDPLQDQRWDAFLEHHPCASAFHSRAWLETLKRSYGYTPVVYTTSHPGDRLRNGLAFCKIESWITGRRLVSLPFSDHCEPLVEQQFDLNAILPLLMEHLRSQNLRYVEIRPLRPSNGPVKPFAESDTYAFHQVDLSPDLDVIFRQFNKDSTQRKIRRAERENLNVRDGNSVALLDDFLALNLRTRRRHSLPPQPRSWFVNLIACFGEALKIYVAYKDKTPVAAILTLRFKDTLVYKYGCSDSKFSNLGGMQLVFWKAIQEAKRLGLRSFDLGRSDVDNPGLNTFKDRLGAEKSKLVYLRYPEGKNRLAGNNRSMHVAKRVFTYTPDTILMMIGNLMYKHIG